MNATEALLSISLIELMILFAVRFSFLRCFRIFLLPYPASMPAVTAAAIELSAVELFLLVFVMLWFFILIFLSAEAPHKDRLTNAHFLSAALCGVALDYKRCFPSIDRIPRFA